MCLENVSERKVATEDMVVYKRLLERIDWRKYHGKPFTGKIDCYSVEGIIVVERNQAYFCTNNRMLNGFACSNKQGYLYSWAFDNNVDVPSILIEGKEPVFSNMYVTPYQEFEVVLGERYTSELIKMDDKVDIGIHSFVNSKDARRDGNGIVVKAIIPKHSEYYEGLFCSTRSIASDTIVYTDEIIHDVE